LRAIFFTLSLTQADWQVLGSGLNRYESCRGGTDPLGTIARLWRGGPLTCAYYELWIGTL